MYLSNIVVLIKGDRARIDRETRTDSIWVTCLMLLSCSTRGEMDGQGWMLQILHSWIGLSAVILPRTATLSGGVM